MESMSSERSNAIIMKVLMAFALALFAVGLPSDVRGQETKPSATATPKPDRAQLEAQFAQVNAARITAKERTKERADAARNAMQIASDIAWMAFDAGKFEEAANWFARSAELKEDNHVNSRGYWEEDLRIHAAETEAKFDSQVKDAQAKLPAAEESKKATLRLLIDTLEKNRYTIRYNDISMLENVARENNDSASLLKYAEQELEIRRLELTYLENSGAPKKEIDL